MITTLQFTHKSLLINTSIVSLANTGNNSTKLSKTCRNSEMLLKWVLWVHMHEYKSNCMHYTSEEALMQWLEASKLIFQSWEQIMEHLVGGLQSQALGFRSLLSVKDVYLKSSTTRALISCLAAGIPSTRTNSQPRGVTRLPFQWEMMMMAPWRTEPRLFQRGEVVKTELWAAIKRSRMVKLKVWCQSMMSDGGKIRGEVLR